MKGNILMIAAILSLSAPLSFSGHPAAAGTSFSVFQHGIEGPHAYGEQMLTAHSPTVNENFDLYTKYDVKSFQNGIYPLKRTVVTQAETFPMTQEIYPKLNQTAPAPAKPAATASIVHTNPVAYAAPASDSAALKLGATGEKVRQLQIMLAFLGYRVTVNGLYDASTRNAVALFQYKTTGTYTGEADPKTYGAIKGAFDQKMALLKQPAAPQPQKPAVATPVPQPKPAAPNGTVQQPQTSVPSQLTADEKAMVDLINQERAKQGLPPLQVDMQLTNVARLKAQDIVKNGYFSHTSPTYGSPFQMMQSFGIRYRAAAENIAQNWSVAAALQAFMSSSGHRANILNPSYTHVGIGIVDGGRFGKTFVQMFIQK